MNKNIIYSIACMTFTIMIGGAVYEHMNVVPKWSAAPPVSLSMFQGEYGLKPDLFWMLIHPVNLALFIISLVLNRKSTASKNLWICFVSYLAILSITAVYFVPELLSITSTAYSETIDAGLTRRAKTWEILSLVRLGVLFILSITLFMGLTKTNVLRSTTSAAKLSKRRAPVAA